MRYNIYSLKRKIMNKRKNIIRINNQKKKLDLIIY